MASHRWDINYGLVELFCGAGGLALGAKNAKVRHKDEVHQIRHVWANDYDRDACETYKRNICPDHPETVVCADVRKVDFRQVPEFECLAFGFPCNDYSVVGEQRGIDGVFGPLYKYGVELLRKRQPVWFVAENVGGLRNANDGKALQSILDELHGCGYSVVPHLYRFEEYGVPQARHRIIIVGTRKDLPFVFRVPKPIGNIISAREAIECPPISDRATNNELTRQSADVIARLEHIRPGENAFTADIPEHLRLNVQGATISQIYKRLDPEKPSYTITGSGGGGTHVYHWSENRALTNRERARLQTFPDSFHFEGSKESVRRQIGMAVPPRAARAIFEAVLKSAAGVRYDSIEANLPARISQSHIEEYNRVSKAKQMRLLERSATYRA